MNADTITFTADRAVMRRICEWAAHGMPGMSHKPDAIDAKAAEVLGPLLLRTMGMSETAAERTSRELTKATGKLVEVLAEGVKQSKEEARKSAERN